MPELPDVILNLIFEFANTGPYQIVYDVKKKKFIEKINPNFMELKRINQYKISHPPNMITDYDLDNEEKTVGLYFTLPLKIPENKRFDGNEFLVLKYLFTVSLQTMIPYHCTIIIPYYYHSLTREYINMYKKLYPTTTVRNFYLYKGFEKKNYGYDTVIG
jgi:hypothetical protein